MCSNFSTPGRLMVFLCLLILAGTAACTDSDVRPGATTSRSSDQLPDDLTEVGNIAPIRVVFDQYPMFAGVAVDPASNQVFLSDDNTFSVLQYAADTPGSPDRITEFASRIGGDSTRIHSACGITIDPENEEIYVLNTDGSNNMVVFDYGQSGDTAPKRELIVDHGGWGMFLDHDNYSELFFTIQHLNKISVYRPDAEGKEVPHRYIQGPKSKLVDPHGIFVDAVNDEIVVTNHHSAHTIATGVVADDVGFRYELQSSGHFEPSSVTVYSRTAEGDVAPLRIIQGPKTKLNLPLGVVVDTERNVILVANDQSHEVLAFSRTAQGNVAPLYILAGSATGLKNPGAFFLDTKNDELWVTNWGDHSVNIYPADARGNVAPLRTIRTAPKGEPVAGLGTPSAIAWDSRRDELLVPN